MAYTEERVRIHPKITTTFGIIITRTDPTTYSINTGPVQYTITNKQALIELRDDLIKLLSD